MCEQVLQRDRKAEINSTGTKTKQGNVHLNSFFFTSEQKTSKEIQKKTKIANGFTTNNSKADHWKTQKSLRKQMRFEHYIQKREYIDNIILD